MKFSFHVIDLKKKIPLRISRGLKSGSRNLFLKIKDGLIQLGESHRQEKLREQKALKSCKTNWKILYHKELKIILFTSYMRNQGKWVLLHVPMPHLIWLYGI